MPEPMGLPGLDARLLSRDPALSTELPRKAVAKGRGAWSFILGCIETPAAGVGAIFLIAASFLFGFSDLIPNKWGRDEKIGTPPRFLMAGDEGISDARNEITQVRASSVDETAGISTIRFQPLVASSAKETIISKILVQ